MSAFLQNILRLWKKLTVVGFIEWHNTFAQDNFWYVQVKMVWDNGEINWHPQVFQFRVESISFGGVNPLFGVGQTVTGHLDKLLFWYKSLLQNESSWLEGLFDRQFVKKFQGHFKFFVKSYLQAIVFWGLRFAPFCSWPYPDVGEDSSWEKLAPSIFYSKSTFSTCSLKGWLVWNDDGLLAGTSFWKHTLDERT